MAIMGLDEHSGDTGVELIDATDPQDLIPNKVISTRPFADAFPEDRSTICSGRLDAKSRRLPGDMMEDSAS